MKKKYLINIALFSFLFMGFILLGSILWSWQWQRMAIICFIFALLAVFGQLFSIVLLSKSTDNKSIHDKLENPSNKSTS